MNYLFNYIRNSVYTIFTLILSFSVLGESTAQVVQPSASTTSRNVNFCNPNYCPSTNTTTLGNYPSYTSTQIKSLNMDRVTIELPTTTNWSAIPSGPGTSVTDYIEAVAFSNATTDSFSNQSGVNIFCSNTAQETRFLPYWFNSGLTGPANDPDVAVGTYYDIDKDSNIHFALAVYENNGDIYLEHYDVYVNNTGMYINPPGYVYIPPAPPYVSVAPLNNNPVKLNMNSGNRCSKPHIEIWHAQDAIAAGALVLADRYVVVWEYDNQGTSEVWAVDGVISAAGSLNPPPPNVDFKVDDGRQPDVVAVNGMSSSPVINPFPGDTAYIAYVDNDQDNIRLASNEYNTQSPVLLTDFNTNTTTVNAGDYSYPRISGPMYYDYWAASSTDPLAVIVANNTYNAAIEHVAAWKYYTPAVGSPPVDEELDITDDTNPNAFSGNSWTAIMPVVTGIGEEVINAATGGVNPYDDYPVAFYSDYEDYDPIFSDGEHYIFGIDMVYNSSTLIPSPLFGGDVYGSITNSTTQITNSGNIYNLTTDRPAHAITTSNNTGYDLGVAIFRGVPTPANQANRVRVKSTGTATPYSFKPGKATSVEEIAKVEHHIYPNPATDHIRITNAKEASFTLFDITGKMLNSGEFGKNNTKLIVSGLAAGTYILQITKEGYTDNVKFIKE